MRRFFGVFHLFTDALGMPKILRLFRIANAHR